MFGKCPFQQSLERLQSWLAQVNVLKAKQCCRNPSRLWIKYFMGRIIHDGHLHSSSVLSLWHFTNTHTLAIISMESRYAWPSPPESYSSPCCHHQIVLDLADSLSSFPSHPPLLRDVCSCNIHFHKGPSLPFMRHGFHISSLIHILQNKLHRHPSDFL